MATGRLPGTQITQLFKSTTAIPRDFPRYCAFVAKGLNLKLFRNAEVTRGEVLGETVFFSGVTYQAPIAHQAIPDKSRSRLFLADGRTVNQNRWNFLESTPGSGIFDLISIDPTIFSVGAIYNLDYVSSDPLLQDEVPVDDLKELLRLGDNVGQTAYREGVDFQFATTITGPTANTGNLFPTQRTVTTPIPSAAPATNTGTGTILLGTGTYTGDYNRSYRVRVLGPATSPTAAAPAGGPGTYTATVLVECFPTSSGNLAAPGRSNQQSNAVLMALNEAIPATFTNVTLELGLSLSFTFGASNFAIGDLFTFEANGPGLIEAADQNLNTNQFPETSAVAVVVATGTGVVSINPQTAYSGPTNRTYELEVTAISGVSPTRTVDFQFRSNPLIKQLSGTSTVTNGSNTVTGTSTLYTTEVLPNDYLYFGNDTQPFRVASVTNSGTLVLHAGNAASPNTITTFATYPLTTQAGVKVLRVRELTGSFQVTEASPGPTRISSLGDGLFVDISFGGINFVVGDTFSFTAKVARQIYNGKENRSYDLQVTSTTTPHQMSAAFSSSTVDGGFGSHTFAEGNPLVLSNNVVLHARNLSLGSRFDATPAADTFDLTLSFDGLIDWTLETQVTEVISSADILRDLTGSVTGTAGTYFVLLRKIPEDILYVRGPGSTFTNFAFSQVAGTTIVYFPAGNPGTTLTIAYRHAGNEPQAGSTYFLDGYTSRPDSDFETGHVFFTRDAATAFLAPMTPVNDAAIANEIAWNQDGNNLPGVVVFLVKDEDGDGVYTAQDYENAIRVMEAYQSTLDVVVVNQFSVRDTFRDAMVHRNDPRVAKYAIGYVGFPISYPIGDEFTAGSRIYAARRELQIFDETQARGTIAIIGNAFAKMTIAVDAVGDGTTQTVPTQVTLDGSFLAVALAARVASFPEPWQLILNLAVSGFDEIEPLNDSDMIRLSDAGIIPIQVTGTTAKYLGTSTIDETEFSTQQLNGTTQRQYVFQRVTTRANARIIGRVFDSAEEFADFTTVEIASELGSLVSEGKIGKYVEPATGAVRALDSKRDVVALRDPSNPTKGFFRFSWYNKYGILTLDGIAVVDGPTP